MRVCFCVCVRPCTPVHDDFVTPRYLYPDFRSLLVSSEPLLDSDEESRRIKTWLKEDEKIEFDFDNEDDENMNKEVRKVARPKSGRVTADDLERK